MLPKGWKNEESCHEKTKEWLNIKTVLQREAL